MAPPLPTLRAQSLATITKHIWQVQELSKPLLELSSAIVSDNADLDEYYSHLLPVYKSIMAVDTLSETVRAQVACAFIKFEQNMCEWAKDLLHILRSKQKEDIAYVLAKTVVKFDLTVNREKTIFRVLFDSYARVRFISNGIVCLLTVRHLYKFIESEKYIKHGRLSRKVTRVLLQHDPLRFWHLAMVLLHIIFNSETSKIKLLMVAIKVTKVEVFSYLLRKLSSQYYLGTPSRVYSQLLFHAMLCDSPPEPEVPTVTYLLKKLYIYDKKVFMKVLTHLFSDIILHIFLSPYTEYSIWYFRQACEAVSVDVCVYTVTRLLEELRNFSEPYGEKALFMKRRVVFFQIWSHAPLKVRRQMFGFLKKDYLHYMDENDFVLLSILLTDFAFSDRERHFLLFVKVLGMQETQKSDVDRFIAHLPERHRGFLDNITREDLKEYVSLMSATKENYDSISFVLKTEAEQNVFKEELLQDKEFVLEVFTALGEDFCEDRMVKFLKWILKDDDEAIKRFIAEKMIGQQWIVDLMKSFFVSNTYTMKTSCLLDFFVEDPEKRLEFKKIIRSDTQLMLKILDTIFVNWIEEITTFLPCIFGDDEMEEQKTLVETYLLSKNGLQAIQSLVINKEDMKNVDLFVKHRLKSCIYAMHQVKEYWLRPFGLTHKVVEVLMTLELKSYHPVQFPHESEADGETIVHKKHNLFLLILNEDVNLDDLIDKEVS